MLASVSGTAGDVCPFGDFGGFLGAIDSPSKLVALPKSNNDEPKGEKS